MILLFSVLAFGLAPAAAQTPAPESGTRVRMGDALYTHPGGVSALACSPDGRLLISAGSDESIRIWDLTDAKEKARFQHPEVAAEFVAVSADGSRCATCGLDNRIRLWTLPEGRPIGTLSEIRRIVAGLAFADRNPLLLSARTDGSMALWDASTGSIVKTWSAHRRGIQVLAASSDGTRVASAGEMDGIAIWNPANGDLLARLEEPISDVRSLAFSPDKTKLAVGSEGGGIAVWDLGSGKIEKDDSRMAPRKDALTALAFAPDGTRLACGSSGGDLAVWDPARGERRPLEGTPGVPIRGLAFSAEGSRLVSGDAAGRVVFWDAARGSVQHASTGHRARIRALAYSPAGDLLASGGDDRSVRIWDAATGKELRVLDGSPAAITSLSFSPDGRRIVTTAQEPAARLWDATTGGILKTLKGERCGFTTAAWSPTGASVATGATDGRLYLFDVAGNEPSVPLGDHTHAITGLLYSRWAETLVSTSYDSTVRIWDLATRKESARFTVANSMPYAMATSPDGMLLAVASVGRLDAHRWVPEHVLTVWDTRTGQKIADLARFETLGPAHGRIEFAPDGRRVLVLRDGALKAWSLPDGQEPTVTVKSGPVTAFQCSPDGRTMALALEDLTIAVRDIGNVVAPPKTPAELDPAALARHWDELARPEADRAFRSICALADSPKSAVGYLSSRLVPVSFEEVERLILSLDDDNADVRDRAAKMIRVVGTPALLEQFLERKPPLETALRIRALIAEQKEMKGGAPELDRALRAISVLEMAGTAEARTLLEKLAAGTESARQTQAARSALRRLAARRVP
ncbi:MAG TPA: WD40 repeat domain-containing protein [Planctomycetota bacterium]|nr:WD40 repeat domain-containing protein [Planctomycetota bacterium]